MAPTILPAGPVANSSQPGPLRRESSSWKPWIALVLSVTGFVILYTVLYIDKCNLAKSLREAETTATEQRQRIADLQHESGALRDSNHTITSVRAALERSNIDYTTRIDQLQNQLQTLTNANSTLSATKVTLENAKSIATKQVQQLQQQLASLTQANRDLTNSNADLNQLRSQSNTKLQLLEKENKDLNAALKEWRIKAETPIDRPIPLAVQTSGTFAFPTELSWGGGDIFLSAPAVNYFSTRSVNLTSKVGDDTTTHKIYLEEPLLKKPIIIKGLRGDLTLDVLKVSFTKAGTLNLFYTPATLQFKASYRPVTVAPETPPAK
jgi:prefoldin subunit 5